MNVNELKKVWKIKKPSVNKDNHGWFFDGNKRMLRQLLNNDMKNIIELGSWLGSSTRFILNNAKNANVFAVDHWSDDMKDYGNGKGATKKDKGIEKIVTLWETFLVNCWDYKDRLIPIREYTHKGLDILSKIDMDVDLVYIDASHGYEDVLSDITKSLKYFPSAIIMGDDWGWPTVQKAVKEVAEKENFKIIIDKNCWKYEK